MLPCLFVKDKNVNLIMSGGSDCEHNGANCEISFAFDVFQSTLLEVVASFVFFSDKLHTNKTKGSYLVPGEKRRTL